MPSLQSSRVAAICKDFTPTEMGWNAVSVNAGATVAGTSVNVRGMKRIGLAITVAGTAPNTTWSIVGRLGGLTAGTSQTRGFNSVASTAAIQATLTSANTYIYMLDICLDEIAVTIQNNSGANAVTITVALVAQPT